MQINRWLYLSSSPWGIPLHCDLFRKRRDPKNFLFIGTSNWIALAIRWSIKYFFATNSPIFRIRLAEKQGEEEHTQMQSVMGVLYIYYIYNIYIIYIIYIYIRRWILKFGDTEIEKWKSQSSKMHILIKYWYLISLPGVKKV